MPRPLLCLTLSWALAGPALAAGARVLVLPAEPAPQEVNQAALAALQQRLVDAVSGLGLSVVSLQDVQRAVAVEELRQRSGSEDGPANLGAWLQHDELLTTSLHALEDGWMLHAARLDARGQGVLTRASIRAERVEDLEAQVPGLAQDLYPELGPCGDAAELSGCLEGLLSALRPAGVSPAAWQEQAVQPPPAEAPAATRGEGAAAPAASGWTPRSMAAPAATAEVAPSPPVLDAAAGPLVEALRDAGRHGEPLRVAELFRQLSREHPQRLDREVCGIYADTLQRRLQLTGGAYGEDWCEAAAQLAPCLRVAEAESQAAPLRELVTRARLEASYRGARCPSGAQP